MSRFLKIAGPFTLGLLVALFVLAGCTGDAQINMAFAVAEVAYRSGMLAIVWWMGAWGLGLALSRVVIGPSVREITSAASGGGHRADGDRVGLDELAIALGLGGALMLVIDAVLGSLGLLVAAGGLVSWIVIAIGIVAGVRALRESVVTGDDDDETPAWTKVGRFACLAGLGAATGLLCVSASVAPGWLWSSEFAGYDALSYHLVLPKTWLVTTGVVGPVEGNVYSALPSFVESAFLQLMIMRGDWLEGAYACQWWSLGAVLATAFVVARLGRACIGPIGGMLAALLFLATPWTSVVGTLAYNDMFPCLALASGWLLVGAVPNDERRLDTRTAAALALLAAAAFGAKPSSVLFAAIPLVVAALAMGWKRGGLRNLRPAPILVAVIVGLAVLAPWLVRNQLAYGSPTFPFLSGMFGLGPWSAEQLKVFLDAHGNPAGLGSIALVWQQWLGYGFGSAPAPNEPWFPLWGVLPLLGLTGIVAITVAAIRSTGAAHRWAIVALLMLVAMLAGWLLASHVKSRFMLPSAIPLAIGAAAVLAAIARRVGSNFTVGIALVALALPVVAFMREPVRGEQELAAPALMVNGHTQRTGEGLATAMKDMQPAQRQELIRQADSSFMINYLLPPDAKLVAIGYSTPFYLRRPISWSTVWDRGVFDQVVEESPGTPTAWGTRLRSLGFTHAVIDPTMMQVWMASGWLNPSLASGAWVTPFMDANTRIARSHDGKIIIALVPPPAPQVPVVPPPSGQTPSLFPGSGAGDGSGLGSGLLTPGISTPKPGG